MPDPIKMLKDDHKKVKELFSQFESADGRSKKRIADEAIMELEIHAMLEEELFYPAAGKAVGEELLMAEAEEEHHVAKVLMQEIQQMDSGDVHFDAKFMVLAENVKHHIQEEEKEMLPKVKMGKPELDALGTRMEQRKMQLMKEMKAGAGSGSRR